MWIALKLYTVESYGCTAHSIDRLARIDISSNFDSTMVLVNIKYRVFVIVGDKNEQDAGIYVGRRLRRSVVACSGLLTGSCDTPGIVNLSSDISDSDIREWDKSALPKRFN
jgi:hypothetical protein